ncbi:MAG: stage II sporulation protein R [Faecalibacterium sp.]|jgi:stage II sporulation protein R|nr:stage II sporulation protein R [Faecalibacterium sp.]
MSLTFWTKTRTWYLSLALGFVLAFALTAAGFSDFSRTCGAIRADTLRLHIVAASDSVADQTLKLQVRNAIVAAAGRICAAAPDQESAKAALRQNLPLLVHTAQYAMAQRGRPQQATAQIEHSYFATAHYGDDTLPAGQYDAVRIRLGAGKGHNWWCCLYPALCLSASGAHYEKPAEDAIVTGDYEIRFACVEWWEQQKQKSAKA